MEKATHIEDAQIDQKSNQNVLIVEDCMLLTIKGVQPTKTGVLSTCGGQQKSYVSTLKQNWAPPLQPKGDTFSFTADQLIKFVATVASQVAQPHMCYTNGPKDTIDKKSSLCCRVLKQLKAN